MSEFSSLLDKLSLLIRHLIEVVRDAPLKFERLVFIGAIQAAGSGLDSINIISTAKETKDYVISTRQFIESMILYVAAKGQATEESQKENFLARATVYQSALAAVRKIEESVDSALRKQAETKAREEEAEAQNEAITLPAPSRPRAPQHDAELHSLQRDLDDLSALQVPVKSPRQQPQSTSPPAPKKTDSHGVTDKLFDYLGEILDHNVLGDKALQDAADAFQGEDIPDIDLDDL